MAPFELSTFNGDWKDSTGNRVSVWEGTRGTQARLTSSSGKEVQLSVTKSRDNLYECGHYEFVDSESTSSRIVWRDKRFRQRVTVWIREGSKNEERHDSIREHPQTASQPRHRSEEWRETRPDEPRHERLDARREEQRPGRERSPLKRPKRSLPMPLNTPSPKSQGSSEREQSGQQLHSPHEANGSTPAVGSHAPPPLHHGASPPLHHGASPPPAGWHGAAPPAVVPPPAYMVPGQYGSMDSQAWSHAPAHPSWLPPPTWGPPTPGVADPRYHSLPPAQLGGGVAAPFPPPMPSIPTGLPMHSLQPPPPTPGRFPEQVHSPASSSMSWPAGSAQAPAVGSHTSSDAPGLEQAAPKSPFSDDTAPPSPNPEEPDGSRESGSTVSRLKSDKAGWSEVLELFAASNHPPEEKEVRTGVPPSPLEPSQPAQLLGHLPVFPPPPPPPPHRGMAQQAPAPAVQMTGQGAQAFGFPQALPPPEQPPGQIAELFSPFGLPQVAPAEAQASEEERGLVLEEILARLRNVVGSGIATAPWRQTSAAESAARVPAPLTKAPPASKDKGAELASGLADFQFGTEPSLGEKLLHGEEDEEIPDWRKSTATADGADGAALAPKKHVGARVVPPEAPLDKFIRVFRLDELAAKCLRALEDDEAAFVIENCQGRLTHARNPSAVVMTSIKGVAARVGRRYWGNREAGELEALLAAAGMGSGGASASRKTSGDLQMFVGSPEPSPESDAEEVNETSGADVDPYGGVADADPYGGAMVVEEEEEEEEEEKAVDEVVDTNDADRAMVEADPDAKRRRIEAPAIVELDLDDDDKPAEEAATSGVVECAEAEAEDVSDGEDEGLFFVDTGGS